MLHRTMLTGISFVAVSLSLALPATAQTKWNLPSAYPANNYLTENLVQFGKDVEAGTGGKIQVTVHPNGSLFKAPDIKRAVATGQAQVGEVLISVHENEDPIFGIDVVPFLASSFDKAKKLWAVTRAPVEAKLNAQGVKVLFAQAWPPQGIYAKKDLNSLDDLKGVKFRSYNPGTARIAELAGAQPVTIQAAELPQALATGVVQSFVSSGATGYDSKVWETLDHWYDAQAWIPKNVIFINKALFDSLPKDQQDAVMKAAAAAEERGWKTVSEKADWYIKELKAKGMKVEPPGPKLAEDLNKAGETLTSDWLKRAGDSGKTVIDNYKKM